MSHAAKESSMAFAAVRTGSSDCATTESRATLGNAAAIAVAAGTSESLGYC